MRVDIMVDIETLGTKIDSTIIQISAIAFDITDGSHYSTFDECVNINNNSELKLDGETLLWWMNENPKLLTNLLSTGGYSPEGLLTKFHNWILRICEDAMDSRDIYLWGNGILFDNKMIEHQMKKIGLQYPIFYRNDRDLRTLVDLTATKLGVGISEIKDSVEFYGDKHNAIDDVKYQIELLMFCYDILLEG